MIISIEYCNIFSFRHLTYQNNPQPEKKKSPDLYFIESINKAVKIIDTLQKINKINSARNIVPFAAIKAYYGVVGPILKFYYPKPQLTCSITNNSYLSGFTRSTVEV